jgi:hypothetical protein
MTEGEFSEGVITLDKPQRGAKDGYLQLFFVSRQQMGRIISDAEGGVTDNRIVTYTKYLISSITDDTIRKTVMTVYKERLDAIKKQKDLGNEAKFEQIMDVSMEILGDVTAFYDEFLGITHRVRIGTV